MDIFLVIYSPCPYLEGSKDALCYKFRRLMIGQGCSAVCINEGGHIDAFLSERHEVPCISRGFSRPPSLERSKRQCLIVVLVWR